MKLNKFINGILLVLISFIALGAYGHITVYNNCTSAHHIVVQNQSIFCGFYVKGEDIPGNGGSYTFRDTKSGCKYNVAIYGLPWDHCTDVKHRETVTFEVVPTFGDCQCYKK